MPLWTETSSRRSTSSSPGSGRAELDDEIIEIESWDAVRVAPSVIRSFEAGPEGMDLRRRAEARRRRQRRDPDF